MSSDDFFNHVLTMNRIIFDSHRLLIQKIGAELNLPSDVIVNLEKKFLDSNIKLKKRKDTNRPKRWCNPYILFCNDKRKEIVAQNPDTPNTEIMKLLSVLWGAITPEEKAHYTQLSNEDKIRYANELVEYKNSSTTYVGKTNSQMN